MEENKIYPWSIQNVDGETADMLLKYYTGEFTGFVRIEPKRYFFPQKYQDEAKDIYNVVVKPTDIFVLSHPRSGTTLIQEMIWLLANDLDYEASRSKPLTNRFPFLEFTINYHPKMYEKILEINKDDQEKINLLKFSAEPCSKKMLAMPSPRFIKSHLPLSLLPRSLLDTAKVVYITRDPRDVAVSYYHLHKLVRTWGFNGDFKEFWTLFMNGLTYWGPYFENVKESWDMRHHPNMLFLFYEDIIKDLPSSIRKVADFLGKSLNAEEVAELCEHLKFDNFQNNKSSNGDHVKNLGFFVQGEQGFVRKGMVGGWRDYFDEEMSRQADTWIAENLKDTDFRYPHLEN